MVRAILQGASPGQRSSLGSVGGLAAAEAQHPSHALLDQHNFTQIKYTAYRDKSLAERQDLGVGKSDEMNTLFRFWCAIRLPCLHVVILRHYQSPAQ